MELTCSKCSKHFKNLAGLNKHTKTCIYPERRQRKTRSKLNHVCPKCNIYIKVNIAKHIAWCDGRGPRRQRPPVNISQFKGMSYEERYGKEKADLIKKNILEAMLRNPSYYKDGASFCKRNWSKVTYEEICTGLPYQKHTRIRQEARKKFLLETPNPSCRICGYDKHIDVCHIKPIGDFEADSLLSQINASDNLVGLCKNHHWEFDHGHLIL